MFFPMLNELKKASPESASNLEKQYIKQRDHFFKRRLREIKALYGLKNGEKETLYGLLLLAEQQDPMNSADGAWILKRLRHLDDKKECIADCPEAIAFLGYLHAYWSSAWRKFADINKHSLAVRWALITQLKKGDEKASIVSAEEDLLKELQTVLPGAEKQLGLPLTIKKYQNLKLNKNRVLELDLVLLNYFQKNNWGPGTKEAIKNLSHLISSPNYNADERREKWDDPLFAYQNIALLRWIDRIRKFVHKKLEKPAALTAPIFKQVSDSLVRGLTLNESKNALIDRTGKQILKFDIAATMQIDTAESILRSSIPLLSSITAHHIVRWQFLEVHKQFLLGQKEPRKLVIEGGFQKLGELSGAGTSKRIIDNIRKIVFAQAGCLFRYRRGDKIWEGNLISFDHWQAKGRNASLLEIEMRAPGCPGFVQELPIGGLELSEQRTLIPIVGLPEFVGRANEHGSQACFQMELFIEMRMRAKELYERGGILLNDDGWLKIAERARMPHSLITKVLDCWIANNYIEQRENYLFNIGAKYEDAKLMLMKAGEAELKGAIAGRKNAAKKNERFKAGSKKSK
jgi:hypothetical protein